MARPAQAAARRPVRKKENGSDSTGNRRVRSKSKPKGKSMTGIWMLLTALFFIQGLFYVWCRVQCIDAGYGIDREMNRRRELLKQRSQLTIELNWLKSPERIESIARNQLGLAMPNPLQTVKLP
jgi:cell division protein FtsL